MPGRNLASAAAGLSNVADSPSPGCGFRFFEPRVTPRRHHRARLACCTAADFRSTATTLPHSRLSALASRTMDNPHSITSAASSSTREPEHGAWPCIAAVNPVEAQFRTATPQSAVLVLQAGPRDRLQALVRLAPTHNR